MGRLERVEVMVMRRRLWWLGHVVQMSHECLAWCLLVHLTSSGKHSAESQKRRWNVVASMDVKKCDLLPDWHYLAWDRSTWHGLVWAVMVPVNGLLEDLKKEKKDE